MKDKQTWWHCERWRRNRQSRPSTRKLPRIPRSSRRPSKEYRVSICLVSSYIQSGKNPAVCSRNGASSLSDQSDFFLGPVSRNIYFNLSQDRRPIIVSDACVLPIERRLEEGTVGELERLSVHGDQLKNIGMVFSFAIYELVSVGCCP